MDPRLPDHVTYLLRLWRAGDAPDPAWRASLENPRTGERQVFVDLSALCAFLEQRTTGLCLGNQEAAAPLKEGTGPAASERDQPS